MQVALEVKNYRCFPQHRPLRLEIKPGFTALIGPNNAGKSTALRLLYEFRDMFRRASQGDLVIALQRDGSFDFPDEITDRNEVASKRASGDIVITITVAELDPPTPGYEKVGAARLTVPRGDTRYGAEVLLHDGWFRVDSSSRIDRPATHHVNTQGRSIDLQPVIAALQSLSSTLYIGPFRNAVNIGADTSYYDLQIGQAFITEWRSLQTGPNRASNEATHQLTQMIRRIFAFDDLQIQPTTNNDTLVLYVNGESRRLHEVGAGLAQFVVCLANAAVSRPDWILIDEPEMNLHPRLQSEFLRSLATFASQGVLYSTHSLGLARSQAQTVYSARLVEWGESEVVRYGQTPRLAEFIGELGYASLREVGFDRLLLVEGSYDVQTVKEFLRLYDKEHRVVVIPLGGSDRIREVSQAELAEVLQISDKVSALIDSERTTAEEAIAPGRQAFVDACSAAGITCHVLSRRAIENYLTDSAIKKVKSNKYRALEPYERLRDTPLPWAKAENWKIAAEVSKADIDPTDLGAFLNSV